MAKMTPLIRHFWELAKKHHLPMALGRALALVNRAYNDGRSSMHHLSGEMDAVAEMKSFRHETAAKWLLHWCQDGSLKDGRKTHQQVNAERRARYAERKSWTAQK